MSSNDIGPGSRENRPARTPAPRPYGSVFISYSRKDHTIADEIAMGLDLGGFKVEIDRNALIGGDEWEPRLYELIKRSDSVVVLLSKESACSDMFRREVEHALKNDKRLVPVLIEQLGGAAPHEALQQRNQIRFDLATTCDERLAKIQELCTALLANIDWLTKQTEYGNRARAWTDRGRPATQFLLSVDEVDEAKHWRRIKPASAPEISETVDAYITASALQKDAEIVKERSLREAETRQRAAAQFWQRVSAGVAAIASVAAIVAVLSFFQAQSARDEAEEALAQAQHREKVLDARNKIFSVANIGRNLAFFCLLKVYPPDHLDPSIDWEGIQGKAQEMAEWTRQLYKRTDSDKSICHAPRAVARRLESFAVDPETAVKRLLDLDRERIRALVKRYQDDPFIAELRAREYLLDLPLPNPDELFELLEEIAR